MVIVILWMITVDVDDYVEVVPGKDNSFKDTWIRCKIPKVFVSLPASDFAGKMER